MAPWRGSVTYATLLTTCPAGLPVKPIQELPAAQTAFHTRLATQNPVFHPARHLRFHTEYAIQAPPSQLERGRQKQRQCRFTHTRARTDIIKHPLKVSNTCVSLYFGSAMLSSRSVQALCPRRSSVQPCHHTFTVAMYSSESADPCFMAAGSIQNAYTTRPLSPEDENMLQALQNKWGHPSNSKFIQIYRAQNRV